MLHRACVAGPLPLLLLAAWIAGCLSGAPDDGSVSLESTAPNGWLDAASSGASTLRAWLRGLEIPLPDGSNISVADLGLEMGMRGGFCRGLELGHIGSLDNHAGLVLGFGIQVGGAGITCHVETESDGSFNIDVKVANSSISAGVQMHPYTPPDAAGFALPLGGFNVTDCEADIRIADIEFTGTSPMVKWVMEDFGGKEGLLQMLGFIINDQICAGIRTLLEDQGTKAVRRRADLLAPLLLPPEPLPQPKALKPLLDWGTYPPVVVVQALVGERFSLWADRVVEILRVASFNTDVIQSPNVSLVMYNFAVIGMGEHTKPGVGIKAFRQDLGLFANLSGLALTSAWGLQVHLPGQPVLSEAMNVSLGLENLFMLMRAYVDEPLLNALEIRNIIQSPKCLLQAMEGTTAEPNASVALQGLGVMLPSQTRLEIAASGSLENDLANLVNTVVAALYSGYMPAVNALLNGALGSARSKLNVMLWDKIDAAPPCTRSDLFLGVSEAAIMGLWVAAIVVTVVGLATALVAQWLGVRRAAREDGPKVDAVQPSATHEAVLSVEGENAWRQGRPRVCLAREPFVPPVLAVFYPFAVVAIMFMFLFADLALGATVSVLMEAGGRTAEIGPVFSFSLLSTVVHSWDSGAYFISALTLLMSGVWPFTKLTLLLIAWLAPPHRFSVGKRGFVLHFLDSWGKYSFLDSWFLVLSMSAFALQWQSVGDASMKVETTPTSAFYAFFAATALSLVLGHVASECHGIAERRRRQPQPPPTGGPQGASGEVQAQAMVLQSPKAAPLNSFVDSPLARAVVAALLGMTGGSTITGIFLTSFKFEVRGIFTEFLFGSVVGKQYSLFSVGISVADGRYGDVGLLGLEVIFVILAIVVPLLLCTGLLVLWLVPMRHERQGKLLHTCHMLDAWASLDVAVLVLVVALLEFGRLTEFLIYRGEFAAPCSFVKDLTRSECVEVALLAGPLIGVVMAAGALHLIVPKVTLRICAKALAKRIESPALPPASPKKVDEMACGNEVIVLDAETVIDLAGKGGASPTNGEHL